LAIQLCSGTTFASAIYWIAELYLSALSCTNGCIFCLSAFGVLGTWIDIYSNTKKNCITVTLWTLLALCGQILMNSPCLVIPFIIPGALANQYPTTPFPNISFHKFSQVIFQNFGTDISLATVLTILFSLLENPDLLNLHARQQIAIKQGEQGRTVTTWMSAFVRCMLEERLAAYTETLFTENEVMPRDGSAQVTAIGLKLDQVVKKLSLFPFTTSGKVKRCGILKPISYDSIGPVFMICPPNYVCVSENCDSYALVQETRHQDVPKVTLIKGTTIHKHAYVVHGKCHQCSTFYYADHERVHDNTWQRSYTNCAKVLKIGKNLWVDREFSNSVLNSMYSYHASASSITRWFNNSFGAVAGIKINRRHIWQAFVQESLRMVASESGGDLLLPEHCTIDEVTHLAYQYLGSNGLIKASDGHSCSECTHPQAFAAGQDADPKDYKPVNMVVVDGIVMGPTVCLFICLFLFTILTKNLTSTVHIQIVKMA
jgi:hypothetical protein